jgi:NTE family protein
MTVTSPLLIYFSRSPLCEGLTEDEVSRVYGLFEEKELPEGATLYKEGDQADALYVLLEGQVQVSRKGTALAEIGPGASIGEMSLFTNSRSRSATVVAQSPLTVLRIDRERFSKAIGERQVPAPLVANLAQEVVTRLTK